MNKKIFVVEDDASIRNDLIDLLYSEGYEPEPFANGKIALDALLSTADSPTLVILDLMMPVMNGYEFLDQLKKHSHPATIPILVISADGQADSRISKGSVAAIMKKPISLGPFLALIEQLVNAQT